MGDTVNLASRLQALAEPGSAVLSEATYRLVEGDGRGELLWRALRQRQTRVRKKPIGSTRSARSDALRRKLHHGLTTFVGRAPELEKLERGFDAIRSGVQVFDIVGRPGIGKSRLVHEFVGQIVKDRARVLVGSCTPDGQPDALPRVHRDRARPGLPPGPNSETVVARKLDEVSKVSACAPPENLAPCCSICSASRPQRALWPVWTAF